MKYKDIEECAFCGVEFELHELKICPACHKLHCEQCWHDESKMCFNCYNYYKHEID